MTGYGLARYTLSYCLYPCPSSVVVYTNLLVTSYFIVCLRSQSFLIALEVRLVDKSLTRLTRFVTAEIKYSQLRPKFSKLAPLESTGRSRRRRFLLHPTKPRTSGMVPNIAHQLKNFSAACPYLARASPIGLRFLATQSIQGTNRLSLLAATQCPAMSSALAKKQFSTSSTASVASSSSTLDAQHTRGYASIVPEPTTLNKNNKAGVPRSTATKIAPVPTSSPSAGTSVDAEQIHGEVHSSGNPTNALGFAKHLTTNSTPFNYEEWYSAQLDKKHADKSYRVSIFGSD